MVLIRPSNEEIQQEAQHIHEVIENYEKDDKKVEKEIHLEPFGEDKQIKNIEIDEHTNKGIRKIEKDESLFIPHHMDEMASLVSVAYTHGKGQHEKAEKQLKNKYPEYRIMKDLSTPDMTIFEEDGENVVAAFRGTELGEWKDYFKDFEIDHILSNLGILLGGESLNSALEKEYNKNEHREDMERKKRTKREGNVNILRFSDKFKKDEDAFLKVIEHYRERKLKDGTFTKFPRITVAGHSLGSSTGYRIYKRFKNYLHDVHLFNVGSNPIFDKIRGSIYKQVVNPTKVRTISYNIKDEEGNIVKAGKKKVRHFYPKIYTAYTKGGKADLVGQGGSNLVGHHIGLHDKKYVRDSLEETLADENKPYGIMSNLYDIYDHFAGRHSIEHFTTGRIKPIDFNKKFTKMNKDLVEGYRNFKPIMAQDFLQSNKKERKEKVEAFIRGYTTKRNQVIYPNTKKIIRDAESLINMSDEKLQNIANSGVLTFEKMKNVVEKYKPKQGIVKELKAREKLEIKKVNERMAIETELDDDLADLYDTPMEERAEKIPNKVQGVLKYKKRLGEGGVLRRLGKLRGIIDEIEKNKPKPQEEIILEKVEEQRRRRSTGRRRSAGRRRYNVLHDIKPQSREKINNIHNNEWINDNYFNLHHDIEANKKYIRKCFYDVAGNWVCKYVKE